MLRKRCGTLALKKCQRFSMEILKILGPGCANCKQLEHLARKVIEELGVEAEVIKVTDPATYLDYGVMSTPALVINEECVSSGRIPSMSDLTQMIQAHLAPK
jgi:small redox-active disulfide protein 2